MSDRLTLPTKAMADVLGVTTQHLNRLAREGVVGKVRHGVFDVADTVQRHTGHRVAMEAKRTPAEPSANRARDARAAEIELRIAERRRELILQAEALAATDLIAGAYLESIGGLPARLTRDPRERQRIEAICDAERQRLTDAFARVARDLRSGRSADEAEPEVAA